MKRFLRALAIASITALAGAIVAVWGGDAATRAHGVSEREGGRAMAVVFLILPAGLLVGFASGLVGAWKFKGAGWPGYVRAQAASIAATLVIAAVIFGGFYWTAPKRPQISGQYLRIELEVRMPPGRTLPPADDDFTVLFTTKGQGDDRQNADLQFDGATESDGRVVIPGSAFMHTSVRQRSFVVNDVGEDYFWFDLPLAARPGVEDEAWTDWWPAPGRSATTDVRGNGGFQIRYRVQRTSAQP